MIGCQDGSTDLPQERVCLLPLPLLEVLPCYPHRGLTADCERSPLVSTHIGTLPHTAPAWVLRPATQTWKATSHSGMKALRAISEYSVALFQTASQGEWNSDLLQSPDTFFTTITTSKHVLLPRQGRSVYFWQIYVLIIRVHQTVQRSTSYPLLSSGVWTPALQQWTVQGWAQPCPSLSAWFGPCHFLCWRSFSLSVNEG